MTNGAPIKRILQTVVSLAIVVGIFAFAFPQFADYGDVWTEITAMTYIEIVTLFGVAIWNLVTYWFVLTAVMPGLTYPQAAVSNQASTAVANTMPGGGAIAVGVTYAMYRSWGFGKSGSRSRPWYQASGTTSPSSGCRSSPWRCWRSKARSPPPGLSRPPPASGS